MYTCGTTNFFFSIKYASLLISYGLENCRTVWVEGRRPQFSYDYHFITNHSLCEDIFSSFLWFFGKKCTWIQNPKFIISALGHAVACHKPAYPRILRGNPAAAFALSLRLICLTPAIKAANLCATPKCMRPSLSFAFAPLFGVKMLQRCNAVTFIANATGAKRYKFLPVCFVLQ